MLRDHDFSKFDALISAASRNLIKRDRTALSLFFCAFRDAEAVAFGQPLGHKCN